MRPFDLTTIGGKKREREFGSGEDCFKVQVSREENAYVLRQLMCPRRETSSLSVDAAFIAIGHLPNTGILKDLEKDLTGSFRSALSSCRPDDTHVHFRCV